MPAPPLRLAGLIAGLLLLGGAGLGPGCRAQPDSVRAKILKKKGFSPNHSPKGALWRSLAVPGWGQLYNRQYLKIPFVYAGFAALGARAYQAHQEYLFYQRAHLFGRGREMVRQGERTSNPYQRYQEQFSRASDRLGGSRLGAMRDQRDQYRRQRNLSILGTGLFYALTVMDAYVSAHLLTFDVGEELTLRVRPAGGLVAATRRGPPRTKRPRPPPAAKGLDRGPGVRLRLQF
ncbi:MAG: DUF5683 domain-containing protein [Salinibacter sp.]